MCHPMHATLMLDLGCEGVTTDLTRAGTAGTVQEGKQEPEPDLSGRKCHVEERGTSVDDIVLRYGSRQKKASSRLLSSRQTLPN